MSIQLMPQENILVPVPIEFIPLYHESFARIATELVLENLRPNTPLAFDATARVMAEALLDSHGDNLTQFDHFYTAFSAKKLLDENLSERDLVEVYIKPGTAAFSRAINWMSPNCDNVVSAPMAGTRSTGQRTSLVHYKKRELCLSTHLEQRRDNGEWLVVLNMLIAFQWKRHYDEGAWRKAA